MGREFFARQGKKRRNTGCIPSIFDAAGRKKTGSDGVPGDFKQALRSYMNGEMSFAAMVLMSIGYIILAGIMGIKWGLLYRMTGNLWVGLGDHLFNNAVATNMLHVVSSTGADKLQIVRIMAAQLTSFVFVLVIYACRNRKADR